MAEDLTTSPESLVQRVAERIDGFSAQLFFCGGHGGHVEYDGSGGPMIKRGGPMDRVFVLRNSGELGGNSGLDIHYGGIDFQTGPISQVSAREAEGFDESAVFTFEENPDSEAVVLHGMIMELDLPRETALFTGSVENSQMLWQRATGKDLVSLPYTAVHNEFELNPALSEHFELPKPLVAVSGWCKDSLQKPEGPGDQGTAFVSQQHLGFLRVFFG
jgi:hypothetical protein